MDVRVRRNVAVKVAAAAGADLALYQLPVRQAEALGHRRVPAVRGPVPACDARDLEPLPLQGDAAQGRCASKYDAPYALKHVCEVLGDFGTADGLSGRSTREEKCLV